MKSVKPCRYCGVDLSLQALGSWRDEDFKTACVLSDSVRGIHQPSNALSARNKQKAGTKVRRRVPVGRTGRKLA